MCRGLSETVVQVLRACALTLCWLFWSCDDPESRQGPNDHNARNALLCPSLSPKRKLVTAFPRWLFDGFPRYCSVGTRHDHHVMNVSLFRRPSASVSRLFPRSLQFVGFVRLHNLSSILFCTPRPEEQRFRGSASPQSRLFCLIVCPCCCRWQVAGIIQSTDVAIAVVAPEHLHKYIVAGKGSLTRLSERHCPYLNIGICCEWCPSTNLVCVARCLTLLCVLNPVASWSSL